MHAQGRRGNKLRNASSGTKPRKGTPLRATVTKRTRHTRAIRGFELAMGEPTICEMHEAEAANDEGG